MIDLVTIFVQKYDQRYGRQMEELKLEVKELLIAPIDDVIEKVKLIDLLCRLDISYHFQNEIQVELSCIFESHDKFLDRNEYDLFTISLLFRILRQHGYKMSSGNVWSIYIIIILFMYFV